MKKKLLVMLMAVAILMPGMHVSASELTAEVVEEMQEGAEESSENEFEDDIVNYGSAKADAVVNFARSKIHSAEWSGYCQAFVKACYESAGIYAASNAGSANEAKKMWMISNDLSNIPVGACVYFIDSEGGGWGHVAIYLGNDRIIHTVRGVYSAGNPNISYVEETSLSYYTNRGVVEGWGWQAGYNLYSGESNTNMFTDAYSESITETDATIKGTLNSTYYVSECGVYVGTSPDAMSRITENANTQVKWLSYNLNKWYGTLQRGTTYYYQLYAVINGTEHKSSLQSFKTLGEAVSSNVFVDAYSEGVTETDATIKGTLTEIFNVSECGVYIGTSTDSMHRIVENANTQVKWLTYNLNKWYGTLQKGTIYYYQLYAVIGGVEYKSALQSFKTSGDGEAPNISAVWIADRNGSSYTVVCTVTDNVEVTRVQFPTWTEANGQDDLVSSWWDNPSVTGTRNGNQFTFTVNMSEHNNESGLYHTHIYAYDTSNNQISYSVEEYIYPLIGISLDRTSKQMDIGESFDLNVLYNPSNTTEVKNVTWKSSDTSVAAVEGGKVTAKEAGNAVITAIVAGKSASCKISVSSNHIPVNDWPFSDVAEIDNNWKYEAVKYVYENEIMNGIAGTNLFAPDNQLNRAMFATVLYRMAGSPEVTYNNKFTDVGQGKYYTSPILWASNKGIVKGFSDGRYGVDTNITREQIAKMLYEYASKQGYNVHTYASLKEFTDSEKVSSWATEYMQWAVYAGMISGKPNGDGTFRLDPKGEATRAECAKMLMMFMEKYK